MDQDETGTPRGKRRSKHADELPRTPKRSARKRRPIAWYQHLSVIIPICACVAFAVLIGGGLAVRRIVFRVQRPAEDIATPSTNEPASQLPAVKNEETFSSIAVATVATVDKTLEQNVAPPGAAAPLADKKPGVKLSKMHLVGPGKDMFPTISDAIKAAEPGDVIEVRTNGPLLELGAELKRDKRVENAPLTIRNGDGFEPVVRAGCDPGSDQGLFHSRNVDLVVVGLNCVSNRTTTLLRVERGHAAIRNCTLSCPKQGALFRAVTLLNPPDSVDSFQVTFERCFFRDSTFCHMRGPRLALDATECGYIGMRMPYLVACFLNEQNRVVISQCSFINSFVLTVVGVDVRQLPTTPINYQINQSALGNIGISPRLLLVVANGLFDPTIATDAPDGLRRILSLEGSHSIRQLTYGPRDPPTSIGAWATVGGVTLQDPSGFPGLPTLDQSLSFGPGVERMRQLSAAGTSSDARALGWTLLPEELATTSTELLAELRNSGINVGCDVTILPVPPPATLEPYDQ